MTTDTKPASLAYELALFFFFVGCLVASECLHGCGP